MNGYRCDACGLYVEDPDVAGLPIGWYLLTKKVHACADDYHDVGHFCSERCVVDHAKQIKNPEGSRRASS